MATFIVLCVLAFAYADKLGNSYRPVDHSDIGLSFSPGGDSNGLGNVGGFSGLGSLGGSGGCSPGRSAPSYHTSVAEYEKECFTYTAHEHDFSAPPGNDQVGETLAG